MDPSTPNTQNQPQQPSVQPAVQMQTPQVVTPSAPQTATPTPATISGNKEQAPIQTGAVQENSENSESVAVQETPTQVGLPVQEVEVQPSMPEGAIEKSVEQVIEKSPDIENPQLPQVVKDAGVTLSGPGVPIEENNFGIQKLPMTYQQAVVEEKQHPKMNDSKRWLAEMVMYIWRKLDPTLGKKEDKK